VVLNAFTEVINRVARVENYSKSIAIKKQQLASLEAAVKVANDLFQNARTEYIDVLFAQRDLRDARVALIDAKIEQLTAIANTYQALGGGLVSVPNRGAPGQERTIHTVREGETFRTISQQYYNSERYAKALWAANKQSVIDPDHPTGGTKIIIPRVEQLDPTLIEGGPAPDPSRPEAAPGAGPAALPPAPPPAGMPGPFGQGGARTPAVVSVLGPNPFEDKAPGGRRGVKTDPVPPPFRLVPAQDPLFLADPTEEPLPAVNGNDVTELPPASPTPARAGE
jgi:hypothetical protein